MAIPASHIVQVLPRTVSAGGTNLELNGLILTDNALISATTMVLEFPGPSAVGEYFGTESTEYAAARIYFQSFNNKQAAPRSLFFARRIAEAAAGWLRGAAVITDLETLKTVTTGGFTISIDSTAYVIENVNLSTANSYSDVAQLIQTALETQLTGTTVTYSSLKRAFTITSPTTGENSVVSYAATPASGLDLAALLALREVDGAILSQGSPALSVEDQMNRVLQGTQNFVTFTTAWEESVQDGLAWAAWANAHYGWLYVGYSSSPLMVVADSSADLASAVQAAGYDHTAVVYGSLAYAAFIQGTIAAVAWERINGSITLAFKGQTGLAPVVTDQLTASILEGKNCNYFGNFATRNAEFIFLYNGKMSASDYVWIDPYINSIWFNNYLQVALMSGLQRSPRTPYNDRGYTLIRAWMLDPVNAAINNRVIETGVTLSEAQRTEVMNEAGQDISEELWTQGYYIQILDPGPQARVNRESPLISIWYTYGGAVQKLDVVSTAIL